MGRSGLATQRQKGKKGGTMIRIWYSPSGSARVNYGLTVARFRVFKEVPLPKWDKA